MAFLFLKGIFLYSCIIYWHSFIFASPPFTILIFAGLSEYIHMKDLVLDNSTVVATYRLPEWASIKMSQIKKLRKVLDY